MSLVLIIPVVFYFSIWSKILNFLSFLFFHIYVILLQCTLINLIYVF